MLSVYRIVTSRNCALLFNASWNICDITTYRNNIPSRGNCGNPTADLTGFRLSVKSTAAAKETLAKLCEKSLARLRQFLTFDLAPLKC